MYRGFIAAFSGEYRASAGPGLAYRTSLGSFAIFAAIRLASLAGCLLIALTARVVFCSFCECAFITVAPLTHIKDAPRKHFYFETTEGEVVKE